MISTMQSIQPGLQNMLFAIMYLTCPVTAAVPGAPEVLLCIQQQYPCMALNILNIYTLLLNFICIDAKWWSFQ